MFRLKERTVEEGIRHHQGNPVRVYENDGVQVDRIRRARRMVMHALAGMQKRHARIIELGCGTADISGPFAEEHQVSGIDCHLASLAEARKRFPKGMFPEWIKTIEIPPDGQSKAGKMPFEAQGKPALPVRHSWVPTPCDVLILCEVLEHLADPETLVRRSLREAQHSVISHPLDEPMGSGLSGGDHCWSFSLDDFKAWFPLGGHKLIEHEVFEMGSYRIALGRGWRITEIGGIE